MPKNVFYFGDLIKFIGLKLHDIFNITRRWDDGKK